MTPSRVTKVIHLIIVAVFLVISFMLSIFLFQVILDRLLLFQFDDAFLSISMRILLTLILFQIFWSIYRKSLIKPVIWITGLLYCLLLLYVVMGKAPGISGVNLNPFTLINDLMTIPFYPISNIMFFVPIGFFLGYVFRKKIPKILILVGFIASIILEIIQLIFHLGIFDITDIILNGCGFAIGVWLFVLVCRNQNIGRFFHTQHQIKSPK